MNETSLSELLNEQASVIAHAMDAHMEAITWRDLADDAYGCLTALPDQAIDLGVFADLLGAHMYFKGVADALEMTVSEVIDQFDVAPSSKG